jgi:drug/metabolite transporter (DMT)-like permease
MALPDPGILRLGPAVALTMVAFAANSVLNRLAVGAGDIDPASFAVIRVAAGAAVLGGLFLLRRDRKAGLQFRPLPAVALALYMAGFSLAYLTLDAGVGALILFGGVQITMFGGALLAGTAVPPRRWVGAAIAFGGLVLLLTPGGAVRIDPAGAALMLGAAAGWGVYSLLGRGAADPLAATAANFVLCLPVVALLLLAGGDRHLSGGGIGLAVLAGAVTSGLGYALWYTVLPRLAATTAAVVQLSVPVIAAGAGALLLGEVVGLRFIAAAALVLGGIGLSLLRRA